MKKFLIAVIGSLFLTGGNAWADQVILDDLIVDGSACIGFDCVNGESFGFDTLRLKENNLRIRAVDTSSTASFPSNDWQITFNDSSNGGANKFSIDDIDGGRTPFTIEAGAPTNSLYVDDGGRLGLGTSTPVVDVHIKSGNTPTLRLEQDGSSGFAPQTWDVAGNEAGFFIRDATNGSTLPFRIRPGVPSSALDIHANGKIGMGTSSPAAKSRLHIKSGGSDTPRILLDNPDAVAGNRQWFMDVKDGAGDFRISRDGSGAQEFKLSPAGDLEIPGIFSLLAKAGGNTPRVVFNNPDAIAGNQQWFMDVKDGSGDFRISRVASGQQEFKLTASGSLTIPGNFIAGGTTLNVPDYVFEPGYNLMR